MKKAAEYDNTLSQNKPIFKKQRIPQNVACDKQYIRYLVDQLDISNTGKAHLLHYLLYASSKCRHSKLLYYTVTSCTIMFPILVTLLSTCDITAAKCASNVLIAATSIAAVSLSLFKFHEKWTRYRNYIESAIAMIMDVIYDTSAGSDNNETKMPVVDKPDESNLLPVASAKNESSSKNALTSLECLILNKFNRLNREHQHLWVQERQRDQLYQNKSDQADNAK